MARRDGGIVCELHGCHCRFVSPSSFSARSLCSPHLRVRCRSVSQTEAGEEEEAGGEEHEAEDAEGERVEQVTGLRLHDPRVDPSDPADAGAMVLGGARAQTPDDCLAQRIKSSTIYRED